MNTANRWFPDGMPQPMVDHHTLPWWQAAAEQRLTVQRCSDCGHCQLPPAPICSECASETLELVEIAGTGRLYTFTVVHRAVAMDQPLPFVIAIIELDVNNIEGANTVRMMSNIVDADPTTLEIGQPVEVVWEAMSDSVTVPRFKISDAS